jgi:hypothetical protein
MPARREGPLTATEISDMRAAYAAGETLAELARVYRCHPSTVGHHVDARRPNELAAARAHIRALQHGLDELLAENEALRAVVESVS